MGGAARHGRVDAEALERFGACLLQGSAGFAATCLATVATVTLRAPAPSLLDLQLAGVSGLGAIAISGTLVVSEIAAYLNKHRAAAAAVPEAAAYPWLLRMVERAQASGSFAKYERGCWMVKKYGDTEFLLMERDQYDEFKAEIARTYGTLTQYLLLPDEEGNLTRISMACYTAGKLESHTRKVPTLIEIERGKVTAVTPAAIQRKPRFP